MNDRNDETMKATLEADRRYEVREMHLFDTDARGEKALCGVDTSADELRGVDGYLDDRLNGSSVGTVCERCKAQAAPFAVNRIRDLEAEGLLDEAEEYRQLADTLLRETGLGGRPTHPFVRPFLRLRGCGRSPSPAATAYSVNRWARPRSLARFRSPAKWRTLGRTPSFLQRRIVCGSVPRRRFISAHGRSDSSLKRTRRCGKSSGKT